MFAGVTSCKFDRTEVSSIGNAASTAASGGSDATWSEMNNHKETQAGPNTTTTQQPGPNTDKL